MATRGRVQREYIVDGVVVNRLTQRGVRGLRVDAWDRDDRFPDLLGQAITDDNGAFVVAFDGTYFRESDPDRSPNLYFVVYRDDVEVLSTLERPEQRVQRGTTRVRLELDEAQAPATGKDRVSAEQAIKAIDWWRASDFRGVFRQGRDKATTVGKLAGLLATGALERFDFTPVRSTSTRERDIVSQDQDTARRALARNQIEVSEVKPVSALSSRAGLRSAKSYPVRLKAGDRVTLYEQDGIVKFYTRDAGPASTADSATIERIDGDLQSMKARMVGVEGLEGAVASVRASHDETAARSAEEAERSRATAAELERVRLELEEVRQASATKDAEIERLKSDLTMVRTAQDDLATRVPTDRLLALERAVARLSRSGPTDDVQPVRPVRPVQPVGAVPVRRAGATTAPKTATKSAKSATTKPTKAAGKSAAKTSAKSAKSAAKKSAAKKSAAKRGPD